LVLHKNSVQHRIRKAEQELGAPIEGRRADLELALRTCDLGPLAPAVPEARDQLAGRTERGALRWVYVRPEIATYGRVDRRHHMTDAPVPEPSTVPDDQAASPRGRRLGGDVAGLVWSAGSSWVDNLADDVTVEGSAMDGVAHAADAVRAILGAIRSLYEYQTFNFVGSCLLTG
jgi:hypothetical protein